MVSFFGGKKFHIKPPPRWRRDKISKTLTSYYSPEDFYISEDKKIVRVSVSIYPGRESLEKAHKENLQLRRALEDFKLILKKKIKVVDLPAYLTKYSYKDTEFWGKIITVKMVELVRKNNHYIIEFFATSKDYNKHVKEFYKMLGTARFA